MGSKITIGSISIDLASPNATTTDAKKCEHFSMRGFVSEVRKKDWKLCWPFPLKDKEGDSMEQPSLLAPLDVPKSRCWSCQNRRRETSSKGTHHKDDKTDFNCCSAGGRSDRNCSNAAFSPDTQEPQILDTFKGKEIIDLNNSVCLNSGDYCPPNYEETGKKTEVAENTKLDHEIGMEVNPNHPITSVPPEADLGLRQEAHANNTGCGGDEVADVELPTSSNPKCIAKISTENFKEGLPISVDDQCLEEFRKASPALEEGTVVTGADNITDHRTEHHLEPVAHHSAVPRRMDNLDEYEFQDHQLVIPGGLPRRKTPKVRLLTDIIIEDEEIQKAKKIAEQGTSSSDTLDTPTALPTQSGHHNKENTCGDVTKMRCSRKRKPLQDKDWNPEAIFSKRTKNEVRKLKGDAETTKTVPNTGSKNEFAGIDLQDGMKKCGSEPKIEQRHTRIKNKKIQVDDSSLNSEPHQGKLQIENQEDRDGVDNVWASETPSRLARLSLTEKEIDTFPLLAQTENDSSYKGKGKIQQVDGELASLSCQKNGTLTKGSFADTDAKIRSNMSEPISVHSVQGEFNEKEQEEGLPLSLNSYLVAQAYDKKCIHQIENQILMSVPAQEGTSNVHQLKWKERETNAVGEPSILSKDRMDANSAKEVCCEASSDEYPHGMPFPYNKHKHTSQVEAGSHFYDQTKKVSDACNAGKTTEVQEVVGIAERYGDQITNKVPEQGTDDIPMDIVELMAKNQYERCLPDAENRSRVPEKSTIRRKVPVTVDTAVYGKGEFRLQKEGPKDKHHEPYGQNGMFKTGLTVGPSQRNSVDYFSPFGGNRLNRNGLYGSPYPLAVEVSHSQKKPGGIHISRMDSSLLGSAQTSKLHGSTAQRRSSDATSQALGGCSIHRTILQQDDEASRIWASATPNRVSSGYDLPKKVDSQSTCADMDMISRRHGAVNKQKRKRDFDLNAEYPFPCKNNKTELHQNMRGTLDLYSNETIPAMHLLSLMDAGMQSARRPFLPGVNAELLKGPFYSRDCNANYDIGTSKDSASSKGPSSDYYSKSHFADKSDALFVPSVTFGASSSGIKPDNQNFVRAVDLSSQIFSKSGLKDKMWTINSPLLVEGGKSPKSILDQDPAQNRLTCMSDFKLFGQPLFENETSTLRKLETNGANETLLPVENSSQSNICSLNRNPADFTMPSTGNLYMIRGEDLKFEEPSISPVRSDLPISEESRQRRNLKRTKLKERVKH